MGGTGIHATAAARAVGADVHLQPPGTPQDHRIEHVRHQAHLAALPFMETGRQMVTHFEGRRGPHQAIGKPDGTQVAAPGAAAVEHLEGQQDADPDQGHAGAIDECPAEDAGGGNGLVDRIAGEEGQQGEHQPGHRAQPPVEGMILDEFPLGQPHMQRFGPFGQQVVGTDPGTERAPAQQPPEDEDRRGADDQIDDHVLEGQHHLQGRIEIGQMKAREA